MKHIEKNHFTYINKIAQSLSTFKQHVKNKINNVLNKTISICAFSALLLSANLSEANQASIYKNKEINEIRQRYLSEAQQNIDNLIKNKKEEILKVKKRYMSEQYFNNNIDSKTNKNKHVNNYKNSLEELVQKNIILLKLKYTSAYNDLIRIYGDEENIKKEITITTLAEHVGLKNIKKDKEIALNKIMNNSIKKDFEKDNSFGISRVIPDTVKEINKKYNLKYTVNDILKNPSIDILYGMLSRVVLYNYLITEMKRDKELSKLSNEKIYQIASDATKTGWVFNRGPGKTIPIIKRVLPILKEKDDITGWANFAETKIKKDQHITKIKILRSMH